MPVKMKELRGKPSDALEKQVRELQDQLFKLRFQVATRQNENPGRIRLARKELARVKTILRERELQAAAKVSGPRSGGA
jgi:large subunit ribosomal protein L29